MTNGEQAIQILSDAADLLEREGWCQGIAQDGWGARCLVGAIWAAYYLLGSPRDTLDTIFRALIPEIGRAFMVDFNDTPGRTVEEVTAALRNAKRHISLD